MSLVESVEPFSERSEFVTKQSLITATVTIFFWFHGVLFPGNTFIQHESNNNPEEYYLLEINK